MEGHAPIGRGKGLIASAVLATAGASGALAESVTPDCVILGKPRLVSSACEFVSGRKLYYTAIRTKPVAGCPADITVEYLDPGTNKIESFVAGRKSQVIQTCLEGVYQFRVKGQTTRANRTDPASRPGAPANPPRDTGPDITGNWNVEVNARAFGFIPGHNSGTCVVERQGIGFRFNQTLRNGVRYAFTLSQTEPGTIAGSIDGGTVYCKIVSASRMECPYVAGAQSGTMIYTR